MPELGFVVYLIGLSYGMGVLWYTLLGNNYIGWMRMAAFPLLGVVIGEAVWTKHFFGGVGQGLIFFDLHIYVVLVSTFIGTLADKAISWLAKEHPIGDMLNNSKHKQQPTRV